MADGDYTPVLLSESVSGLPIIVTATSSPGTLIHTPSTTSPDLEFVTLYAHNMSAYTVILTLQFGGTSYELPFSVGSRSFRLLCDRYPIRGASNVIRVYADTSGVIAVTGRITEVDVPA